MKIGFTSYLAEYLGAFFFILMILASAGHPLIVGATLAITIFLIATTSGGHINPAVSLAMYLNGSLTPINLLTYVFVQLLGGFSAYYAYSMVK